jgi:hypothetical protein
LRIDRLPPATFAAERVDGRHLLWREQHDERRIWILPEAGATVPVAALIPFDRHVPLRLESVLRLWERLTTSAVPPIVSPLTRQQRRRMILMLRALDGRHEHATYRDLAAILIDPDVRNQSRRDWLTSPRRAQIIRIVKDGIRRVHGGYRELLRGR